MCQSILRNHSHSNRYHGEGLDVRTSLEERPLASPIMFRWKIILNRCLKVPRSSETNCVLDSASLLLRVSTPICLLKSSTVIPCNATIKLFWEVVTSQVLYFPRLPDQLPHTFSDGLLVQNPVRYLHQRPSPNITKICLCWWHCSDYTGVDLPVIRTKDLKKNISYISS